MPSPIDESTPVDPDPFDLDDLTPITRAAVLHELRSRKALKRWDDGQVIDWDVPPSTHPWLKGLPTAKLMQSAVRSISGKDDRISAEQAPAGVPQEARSGIAAVMSKTYMTKHEDGTISWPATRFKPVLCGDEKFAHEFQIPAIEGTAFAVRRDRLITAGHVFKLKVLTNHCFVFGPWTLDLASEPKRIRVPAGSVVNPRHIVSHSYDVNRSVPDYCVIDLDGEAPTGAFLCTLAAEPARKGTPLYTLGHSHRLALKYTAHAEITADTSPLWLGTSLDVLGGCSGSPVFDANTHQVIGIVAHGDTSDTQTCGNCYCLVRCNPCNEACTRITQVPDPLAGPADS